MKIEGTPVYLDVEGLSDREFYYLIGLRVTTTRGFEQYSLWADTVEQERSIWANLLNILSKIDNPVLIHYGRYESIFLKRMCDRYGRLPKGLVRGKIINGALNLLSIIFAQVYFPTYSNGLKDIASFIGAHWQAPQANGLHTILWRSEWERTRVVSLKDQLIAYNRDDCAALALLAEELVKLGRESKSRVDVDFPHSPKQALTERSAEIHRTFEGLLKSGHLNYLEKSVRFRALRIQASTDSEKQIKRRVKKRKLSTKKGRLVRVPRKRICPKHPTQELMPSRQIAEQAFLDVAFTRNGCRRVVVRYTGKKAYCPLCDEIVSSVRELLAPIFDDIRRFGLKAFHLRKYQKDVERFYKHIISGHPAEKRVQNQVYGRGFQAWAVYQRVALRLSYGLLKDALRTI